MRALLVSFLAVAVFGPCAHAADTQVDRVTLTGLAAISVVVENVSPILDKSGLTTAAIETLSKARLRQAGIHVVPDANVYLYFRVTVGDPGASVPLPYIVELSLIQEVMLPRAIKTRMRMQCPTWSVRRLGVASIDRVPASVRDSVGDFVDQFIRAFRSVNPKP